MSHIFPPLRKAIDWWQNICLVKGFTPQYLLVDLGKYPMSEDLLQVTADSAKQDGAMIDSV